MTRIFRLIVGTCMLYGALWGQPLTIYKKVCVTMPGGETCGDSDGRQTVTRATQHAQLPDRKLTPGATNPAVTQATIKSTICKPGYTATVRNVTDATKRQVIARYGLPVTDLNLVEIDHFWSLEVGGSNDITNLWPQYYAASPGQKGYLGARAKDVVETWLKRQVCSEKMTLREAQDEMWLWPQAYAKISK